jgi:hypothetical protein
MNLDSEESNFLTKKRFSKMIENTVRNNKLSYMDAVVYLCKDNSIELEDVKKFISTTIKERIEVEAMNLNYLPKGNTLPEV